LFKLEPRKTLDVRMAQKEREQGDDAWCDGFEDTDKGP
jgi:hypothetical protein